MNYGEDRTVDPTGLPVTMRQCRLQIRHQVDDSSHDEELIRLANAATAEAEDATRRSLLTQTRTLTLDRFPTSTGEIYLPYPPIVSAAIEYIDTAGDTQTWDSSEYTLSTDREPGMIRLAYAQSWPSLRGDPDAVTITYVAGYTAAEKIPARIIQGILVCISQWFDFHEEVVVGAAVNQVPLGAQDLWLKERVGDAYTEYAAT